MGARHTILFVDDEQTILDVLAQTFQDDYDVITANSGEAALKILHQRQLDLLVTDQKMPAMTGVELIERARAIVPELTSLLLTAYTDPPDIIAAINRGHVWRYVTKPWDLHDLTHAVRGAIEHVELKRQNAQLLADSQRRLAALQVAHEVSRAAATLSSYADIVDKVTELIERVVPLDVSATLVCADGARAAGLTLRVRSHASESVLTDLKYDILERHRMLTGQRLSEEDVLLRVTGRRTAKSGESAADGEPRFHSRLFLPLYVEGRPSGMLMLAAYGAGAFGADDERILDLLANQTAEAIACLHGKLEAERRRLRGALDGLADGLVMTDAQGHVIAANTAARQLLGVAEGRDLDTAALDAALGVSVFDIVRDWERMGSRTLARDGEVGGKSLSVRVSPLSEPDGRLAGVVAVLRDATSERDERRRKDEFISFVSHELRTPLTSINGTLDLFLENRLGTVSDEQRRFLAMAKSSVQQLNGTIDDLVDVSQVARGRLRLDLEVVALNEIVAAAVEQSRSSFDKKGVAVHFADAAEPLRAAVDRRRIEQVINNLLSNAVKFTPAGGEVEVEVFQERGVGEAVGFSVWNSGGYIAPEDRERVFEKFEQVESAQQPGLRGSGIGLAICRSIVSGHGGHIWVESARERGTRFVVMLPLEGLLEAEGEATLPMHEPGEAAAAGKDTPLVLVVDDDRPTAYAIKSLLLSRGFAVHVAHNGEDALALARQQRPAVVLVDFHMPEVSGPELMEILRHDPETRGVPIAMISSPEENLRAVQAGADAFLPKPLESARLAATVTTLAAGVREGKRVLIVDDDPQFRLLCAEVFSGQGYNVGQAATAAAAQQVAATFRPDLVLMDIMLPDHDGFRLYHDLKSDIATSEAAVIFVSGRSDTDDKVHALRLGADDYVVKPVDAKELAARVETALRRRELAGAASPTTRLPGGLAIEREVTRRLEQRQSFVLCYLDLDNLKAFNDYYGYAKADGVIRQTGDLLREVMATYGTSGDFLGHIAGDDFVLIAAPETADAICQQTITAFDRVIPLYYGREDRKRGYIETEDRYGNMRRFPIMSVSVVAVCVEPAKYRSHAEIAQVAAGLKKRAKAIPGSVYLRDDEARSALA